MRRSPQSVHYNTCTSNVHCVSPAKILHGGDDGVEVQEVVAPLAPAKTHRSHRTSPTPVDSSTAESADTPLPEISGREKLKRHRVEVAGHVWIPDIWGQEEFLKDWIDCSAFDTSLYPKGIMSARAALVQECARTTSGGCVKS